MDSLQNLLSGFATALSPDNLLFAFMGSFIGTLVGVLPGIGPTAAMAMLIPLTFQLPPTGAIIMLAAIYYGSQYGGTITSVLMSVPGEPASVVTCFDGHPMAKQGRGGVALSIAAIGSFLGGTVSILGLVVAAPPLARMALQFGPAEQFALMIFGLSMIMALAGKSLTKALISGVIGLLLAVIGMEPTQAIPRFTFGEKELLSGVAFVPVCMGLFGLGEVLESLEETGQKILSAKMDSLIPRGNDLKRSGWPIVRGTVIGFFLGLVPGMIPSLSTFLAYTVERKVSKHPEEFGNGAIEGVAAPETANNSFVNAALVPLLTLGIPTTPSIAILMGAFMMNGLIPGPFLFREHPDIVWAVIASLYTGNLILLVLNLPLIGLWVKLLELPHALLMAIILAFMLVGAWSYGNSTFDVGLMVVFGLLGYVMTKLDFPLAPLMLTLILGPMIEKALRNSLQMSQGDFSVLVSTPISAVMLLLAAVSLISSALNFLPTGVSDARSDSE